VERVFEVAIVSDTRPEADESFEVRLLSTSPADPNAGIDWSRAQAVGRISDDDR